ncbi:copper amine oxidase N-terminal domain-containing protein [Cohnella sp. AR92]|uniref:copper amine oxidase N-terminal domain-containing protein n=1 Tax=Cohnella sp. AR92 TaxID=648716 RepID=UPI000F8F209E|nr:copper amine oxidase N-terminal domain-containing protein [Cohnella sp. AR92]RUS46911.1 copper amine oxidase N-terminal domain-containing protein [Cohnella sp. AR92]
MKISSVLLLFLIAASVATPAHAAGNELKLVVDGVTLPTTVAPEVKDGHTMVPLRVVGETIGADVNWANGVVTITQGETKVVLTPGQKGAKVNGKAVTLETIAYVKEGRVLVPLRFVGETLGCDVGFAYGSVTVKTAPFAIGGTNVAVMREEHYNRYYYFISELRGNYFTSTTYWIFESGKQEAIEAPAQYTSDLSDVPAGTYKRVAVYDFLDANGKSLKRYEGYVLGEGDRYVIYDATENQWYTLVEASSDLWDKMQNAALDYGFWRDVDGGLNQFPKGEAVR